MGQGQIRRRLQSQPCWHHHGGGGEQLGSFGGERISENVLPIWTGTATKLLHALELIVGEKLSQSKHWPSTAAALGRQIKRIAPPLRRIGIEISSKREGQPRDRTISIERLDDEVKSPSALSALSAPPTKPRHKPLFDNDFS